MNRKKVNIQDRITKNIKLPTKIIITLASSKTKHKGKFKQERIPICFLIFTHPFLN